MAEKDTLSIIKNELFSLSDSKYAAFQAKLVPNISPENILGVRIPVLREYAKKIYATEKATEFLRVLPHRYYDENNLHAFLLERIADYDELICELDRFLPYVDNWATCDMLRPKIFSKHKKDLSEKVLEWMCSEHTYAVRFGIEMLMLHFFDGDFSADSPLLVAEIQSNEYYINMMRAWFFAEALAKRYDEILPLFENPILDTWTHNKALQKAMESYRLEKDKKAYLRTLKIK